MMRSSCYIIAALLVSVSASWSQPPPASPPQSTHEWGPLLPPKDPVPALVEPAPPKSSGDVVQATHVEAAPASLIPALDELQLAFQDVCGPIADFWLSSEFMTWSMRDGRLPPLVTSGFGAGTGALGQPTTNILVGGDRTDFDVFYGGRFIVGAWLHEYQTIGIEGTYFFLGERTQRGLLGSTGGAASQLLARPFFNVDVNAQDALAIANPGGLAGGVDTAISSALQGGEGNMLFNVRCAPTCRIDVLAGFRYLELLEDLRIVDTTGVTDFFATRSRFYGGQLGLRTECHWRHLLLTTTGKVALGETVERLDIYGVTRTFGGIVQTAPGGLLAQPSNSGVFERNRFAFVPELDFNIAWQCKEHVRLFGGYSVLLWSDVVRPGDQIDLGVSPSQAFRRPVPAHSDSWFWVHGINVGVEVRY